jgi:hypothetical protein
MKKGTKVKIIDRSSKYYMRFGHITEIVVQGKQLKYFVVLEDLDSVVACSRQQIVAT